MQILFVALNFRQGWGGGPESIRLMARALAPHGFSADVCDLGKLHREIERLETLPAIGTDAERFDFASVPRYDAIIVAGPWQSPRVLGEIYDNRQGQATFYLPRGGLCAPQFGRLRDMKKWPYLYLVERKFIDRSDAMILSSRCEQDGLVAPVRTRSREIVIPDLFLSDRSVAPDRAGGGPVTLGFMAEIAPGKGLLPLVQAFVSLSRRRALKGKARLIVGGGIRNGCQAYYDEIVACQAANSDVADITFVGAVPHDARAEFYSGIDIFVSSGCYESFGLTVFESLSTGCGIIAGPHTGALEYLAPNARVTVARSTGAGDLEDALAAQLDMGRPEPAERQAIMRYAQQAVEALNAVAIERWMELLDPRPASGARVSAQRLRT